MKNDFYTYLDGFNRITAMYPKNLNNCLDQQFCLIDELQSIELKIEEAYDCGHDMKYILSINETVNLNTDYTILDSYNNRSSLRSGSLVRTDLFDMLYQYNDDDLGFTYTKDKTIFKVWSPVAKELELELIDTNDTVRYLDFKPGRRGIWTITVKGDLERYKYRLNVRVNDSFQTVTDPYGIATNANGEYSVVIDRTKTYQFKYAKPYFSGNLTDAIIYELSVRDFTMFQDDNPYKGKFLGMLYKGKTKNGHSTGIEYLKDLGVTHVQLLPVFDFGGVDELDVEKMYNWGYNPEQYNCVDGSFATDPNDPYCRINELKRMIDEFHKVGINVIMDVVYNHVYDLHSFPFQALVPGYYYRHDENGMILEVSGCGNDIASEKRMASQFIITSSEYWMKEFHLSGFRIDLMGLLDIETVNGMYSVVRGIDPNGLLYGEGWNMDSKIRPELRANMNNQAFLPDIGFFNDSFRDKMRGNNWGDTPGFAMNGRYNIADIIYLVMGSTIDNYLFDSPQQSINYCECHDNYTYVDLLNRFIPNSTDQTKKDFSALALSMVLISQGVSFIHSGQEFMRDKKGVENTYNSPDDVNAINWNLLDEHYDLYLLCKDLIEIRKKYYEFRMDKKSLIKQKVKFDEVSKKGTIRFTLQGTDRQIVLLIKNNYYYEYFTFEEQKLLIFNGRRKTSQCIESLEVKYPGVYIIVKGHL